MKLWRGHPCERQETQMKRFSTVFQKMHQLWNGTARNYKDRLWWHLGRNIQNTLTYSLLVSVYGLSNQMIHETSDNTLHVSQSEMIQTVTLYCLSVRNRHCSLLHHHSTVSTRWSSKWTESPWRSRTVHDDQSLSRRCPQSSNWPAAARFVDTCNCLCRQLVDQLPVVCQICF